MKRRDFLLGCCFFNLLRLRNRQRIVYLTPTLFLEIKTSFIFAERNTEYYSVYLDNIAAKELLSCMQGHRLRRRTYSSAPVLLVFTPQDYNVILNGMNNGSIILDQGTMIMLQSKCVGALYGWRGDVLQERQ
jgi:hypothetical protein